MPGQDRTGPMGEGPRTGRGFGYCNKQSGNNPERYGRGFGCRRGFGRRAFNSNPLEENLEKDSK